MAVRRSPARRRRDALIAVLVMIVAAALIGSKLSEGPASYTTASTAHSHCGGPNVRVGGAARPLLRVENTSGHDWKTTYTRIEGARDFRTAQVSLDDQQSEYEGGGIYSLGPLAAGSRGEVRLTLVASAVGTSAVHLQVWGAGSTTSGPNPPAVAPGIACAYTIAP
jgi:hypothetical protein